MKQLLNKEQLSRILKRMTHEIIERNADLSEIILVGILKKGYPIARFLKDNLQQFAEIDVEIYPLDVTMHRDDHVNKGPVICNTLNINGKQVILVDDVLYTGRTVRAAMDTLNDFGRPKSIQLAVLIDRGHRELPIRADYIGKNIPTSKNEKILV
ncbi:MAG: bifunctional pyr operon transcriptional regulator/uracil phosphoribosyltransferase PyrR, partial [Erysipelotrichia bacterium]|nr:bifunctional pyr operon transcriptional regulator/uracil phosphoribosyltransferase PyrR [Erysipelotrichia bacterium]